MYYFSSTLLSKLRNRLSARAAWGLGILGLVPLLATGLSAQAQPLAESRFETDTEGWSVVGGATGPQHVDSGGNPGGYIEAQDDQLGSTWYWSAPASFLEEGSASYGGSLQFALISFDGGQEPTDGVRLVGEEMTLIYDLYTPGTEWTEYTVPVQASVWKIKSTGETPTPSEMKDVLANLSELLIQGEYKSGDDRGGLDSVVLTEESSPINYALLFDGTDDIVTTPLEIDQTEDSPGVTMEAWVYPTSTSSGRHQVVSSDDGGFDWSILREGDEWYVFTGSGSAPTGFRVDLNTWQHVAAVFGPGTGVRFYKNGREVTISNIGYDDGDNPIAVGDNPASYFNALFAGVVDEVRVWNTIRTQEQIQNNLSSEISGDESGLAGYWLFNEGQGTTTADETGNGNDGTLDGPSWVTAEWTDVEVPRNADNYGLRFDGVDAHVAVSNANEINTSEHDVRTIEAWFRVGDKTINGRKQIIWEEGGPVNGFNLYVYDGRLYVGAWSEDNGWSGAWLQTSAIQSRKWHHVALVFDQPGGVLKGYLDGTEFGSAAVPTPMAFHPDDIGIGAVRRHTKFQDSGEFLGSGQAFGGVIDEVRIWNAVRTQSEIQNDRFSTLSGGETELVAYWPFNEGGGLTTADASGNGNTGTLEGATWTTVKIPGLDAGIGITDGGDYASEALSFEWTPLEADAVYRLELATTQDPAAVLQSFDVGSATSHTVDASTLEEGQAYYARVLASTDGGSTFSTQSDFTDGVIVDRTPPTADRPGGQLTDEAEAKFTVTGSDNGRIDSFRVQVSDDPAFGSVLKEATIRPGRSVLYDGDRGETFYARAKAIDGAGLESSYSGASEGLTIPRLPDLTVSSVSGPSEASSGQTIRVDWIVSNVGDKGTNVPKWFDAVYLSSDDTFDSGEDTKLGSARNVSFLGPQDQYAGQAEVDLPRGIEGTHHLFVRADDEEAMAESDEANNVAGTSMSVDLAPYPDLEVTDLQVPETAFSGDTVQVAWTVTNKGTGPADLDEWSDAAFLSGDDEFDFIFTNDEGVIRIEEPLLGTTRHQGPLAVDSSYQASAQIPLPVDSVGSFHLFVYTDMLGKGKQPRRGDLFEHNQELDNWTGDSIDINLTPPPDLTVTSVEGPSQATSGETVDVSWTVENQGPGPTPDRSDSWNDVIYYSPTPSFDSTTAEVLRVASRTGALASDSSYTASLPVTVPNGAQGEAYFFVRTDWNEDVFEHTFEDNNRAGTAAPTTVQLADYPDLQARNVRLEDTTATAGREVVVRYTTENAGSAEATGWEDSLYVSESATWTPDGARGVAAASSESPLGAGASRERSVALRVPSDLSGGTYYVYAQADGGEEVFENPDTTANVARSPALAVEDYPPVDLSVQLQDVPATASSGASITPRITVSNVGEARPRTNRWVDAVYLSKDSLIDANDRQLVSAEHETGLRPGEEYTLSPSLSISSEIAGDYYLLVRADDGDAVQDATPVDNLVRRALPVERPTPSDLVVSSVAADSSGQSGQPATIEWTVENAGSGETRDSTWYDAVYLSRDPSVSDGDVQLGTVKHTGALASQGTYRDSLSTDLPLYASGTHYLLVQTDTRDDAYEHQAEGNNAESSPIDLTLPPPSDLTVTSISAPDSAVPGEEVTVNWTIENTSQETAEGTMREGVFVSKDTTWDVDDPLLGTVEREISLGPGQSSEGQAQVNLAKKYKTDSDGTVTSTLPGVASGSYHMIVRTDLANNIRETDDENNSTASTETIESTVPSLKLGSTTSFSSSGASSRYYRVDVSSGGKDLVFALTSEATQGAAKLFARRGAVPTRNTYDFAADEPFSLEQETTIPDAEAGTYFFLVEIESVPDGGASFSLSAKAPSFSVRKISPEYGGNGGVVTVLVEGAQFESKAQLALEADDGTRVPAQETHFGNSTLLKGRFNLRDQTTGSYDVVVQNPAGSETRKPDAFTIEPSEGADPYVELTVPSDVRSRVRVTTEVTIGNRGNENAVDLFLIFAARGIFRGGVSVSGSSAAGGMVRGKQGQETGPRPIKVTDNFPHPSEIAEWDLDPDTTSFGIEGPNLAVQYPFWFYEIPPGTEFTFELKIRHSIVTGSVKQGAFFLEMPSSPFKRTASPDDIETSAGAQAMTEAFEDMIEEMQASGSSMKRNGFFADYLRSKLSGATLQSIPGGPGGLAGAAVGAALLGGLASVGLPFITGVSVSANAAFGAVSGFGIGSSISLAYNMSGPARSGFKKAINELKKVTNILASQDPNDIVGPGGVGEKNWVRPNERLGYKIRFENDPERATAPAQTVEIRHPLDEDVDARSFELGSFNFANRTFDVPPNRASYSKRLDVRDSLGLFVDVTAGLDLQSNEAFWRFQSIDPETGSPPTDDPFGGFLPVNDSTGRGEGFVRYRVQPSPDATTGTEIEAQAEIVFDQNAPIETPPVVNTVDADDPSSELTVVPREAKDGTFRLSWDGSDVGAGLNQFQLYVAEGDSGRFEPYESSTQDTSLVFTGEKNKTYRFYTRATDFVGNAEPRKAEGDTTRTLPVELAGLSATQKPGKVLLQWSTASETNNAGFYVERSVDGKPFEELQFVEGHGTTTQPQRYRFTDTDLPFEAETLTYRLRQVDTDGSTTQSEPVVVERSDPKRFALHPNYPNPPARQTTVPFEVARSSQVRVRLYDILGRTVKTARLGQKDAGRYEHRLDVSRFASGVYFFELRAKQEGETLFREVQKITVVK